jgi:hypothetical protein
MSRVNNILAQMQDRITMRFNRPTIDTEGSLSGPGFVNQYPSEDDEDIDVDDAGAMDTPYVTHRPFMLPTGSKRGNKLPFESKGIKEQDEDEAATPEEVGGDFGDVGAEAGGTEDTGDVGTDMGADMGAGDMGSAGMGAGDMGAGMGIPGMEQEEPKTSGELGRIYELKKIYARLTSIESYLGNESSQELLEIRNLVSKSIELFEVISANFDSYKDKLDEIIVTYYKFIMEVYTEVKNYFKKEAKSSGDK